MEARRRFLERRGRAPSAPGRHFRHAVYALVGVVLSAYLVLFVIVVSRHIDQGAREDLKKTLSDESKAHVDLRRGIDSFGDRWAAAARMWGGAEIRAGRPRRRIHLCVRPRFREPPGPVAALASFPGSGNTWIRFLVQQATGYLTGSVYRDYSLKRNGFPAESIANGSVLLVKTHEWGAETRGKFQRAVLLVREPYGALLAEFNRRSGGHVGHASPDKFHKGNAWPSFVQTHSRLWMESILDWLQFEGPLLVLRYETMSEELPGQLIRLLKFLDANITWGTFQCVIRNKEGIFRRSKKHLNFELFQDSLKTVVEGYKTVVDTALRYHEQGIKFDINNTTLLHSEANNGSNVNLSILPVTYVDKDQNGNS